MITVPAPAETAWKFTATVVQSGSVCPANCARGVTSNHLPAPPCLSWQRAASVASAERIWLMLGA